MKSVKPFLFAFGICFFLVIISSISFDDNYNKLNAAQNWKIRLTSRDYPPDITILNSSIDSLNLYISCFGFETEFIPYPIISWCKIEENEEDGIYFKMAEGYVEYTSVKNNNTRGIYCWHNLSRPYIYRSKITGNPTGIRTFYSDPKIGDTAKTDSTGYNTIDNEDYNLYNGYGMVPPPVIKAENCYWGQSPPDTTKFNRYVSEEENKIYVDYDPYLTSDPVTYLARSADGDQIPTSVYLYQNFPNPLTGGRVTQIRYSLPKKEKVTISLDPSKIGNEVDVVERG